MWLSTGFLGMIAGPFAGVSKAFRSKEISIMTYHSTKELKSVFESLVRDFEKKMSRYVDITRKKRSYEASGNIAFEMSNIFKLAKESLPSDPASPYSFDAFEKEYHRIRTMCFNDPDTQTPDDSS
jgi:hypothetical protein